VYASSAYESHSELALHWKMAWGQAHSMLIAIGGLSVRLHGVLCKMKRVTN